MIVDSSIIREEKILAEQWVTSNSAICKDANEIIQCHKNNRLYSLDVTLRDLNLSRRGLEDSEISQILPNLFTHPLKSLNLQGNEIASEGCKCIAKFLTISTSLQALNLSKNTKISDEGIKIIFEALKSNRTLKFLNIQYTGITSEGVKSIVETIQTHPLQSLDIYEESLIESQEIINLLTPLKQVNTKEPFHSPDSPQPTLPQEKRSTTPITLLTTTKDRSNSAAHS